MVGNRGKKSRAAKEKDDAVIMALEKLQGIQQELEKVNKESHEKLLEIKQKYAERRKPVYMSRNEIISEIPNFWLTVFVKHPTLLNLLTFEDHKMFGFLDSLNVEDLENPRKGYCISFEFKANPFFENEKLTKTVEFLNDGRLKSIGTTINWKDGFEVLTKKLFYHCSFFSWFSTPKEEVEHDLVAEIIKEEIWPNPNPDYVDNAEAFRVVESEDDEQYEEIEREEEGEDRDEDDSDSAASSQTWTPN